MTRPGGEWLISAVGRLDPPVDLATTKFEVAYDADWRPRRLAIEARVRGEAFSLTTTFGEGMATSAIQQGQETASRTVRISPGTVVLPNSFFGAYEALAVRLQGATSGTVLPVFGAPDTEVQATVNRVTPRRILTPDGTVEVQDYALTLAGPAGPVPLEVWVDSRSRLARVVLPAVSIVVLRDDLASVMSREEPVRNPGDESVYIPANGFSLAATLTRPVGSAGRTGAVVLVASPGPQGREHMSYGIPIFGQIAGRLAAAGYTIVRYDARGVGQTGGRTESAAMAEYAEDAIAVVSWLRKRQDVDANRVVAVGYGDGGPIALTAAARDKNIRGVALLAAPGRDGRAVTLEQQERLLESLAISDAARREKIDLQTRVVDAVLTGRGWDALPRDLRAEFDSPWFRSWIEFSPANAIKKIDRPLLIVHGALDRELPSAHADLLESLSSARKAPAALTQKAVLPGVNHLLVPAETGEIDEYVTLASREVSPDVARVLVRWLGGIGVKR